jgi:hypothetical protein
VKLTVDSSEPLQDTLRVLGALYGVTLVVSPATENGARPAAQAATKGSKRSVARARRSRELVSESRAAKSKRMNAETSVGPVTNADVRAWARETCITVRDRGRVPSSVVDAYRQSHQEAGFSTAE